MTANKTSVASDSAAELRDLTGDDARVTFETSPNSNPSNDGSRDHLALRDTDDTEDSEEEEEELEEEDEDDEDDDEDDEDDDEAEVDSDVLQMAEPSNVHGLGKKRRADIEEELEEMEGGEDDAESVEETEQKDDDPQVDRGIDAALRMRAPAAGGSGFAAHPIALE